MRGGGTRGALSGAERARAGEPGEYHHSRNLMKNIAVGSNTRSELRRVLGAERTTRVREKLLGGTEAAAWAAIASAR